MAEPLRAPHDELELQRCPGEGDRAFSFSASAVHPRVRGHPVSARVILVASAPPQLFPFLSSFSLFSSASAYACLLFCVQPPRPQTQARTQRGSASRASLLLPYTRKQVRSSVHPSVCPFLILPSVCLSATASRTCVPRARATVPPRSRAVPVRGRWWTERNGMVVVSRNLP